MKKTLLTLISCSLFYFSFAGGIVTNTNQTVHFLRNPSRDASTSIDAVYTNPAGTVFLEDGWQFSFNNQSCVQLRTIKSDFVMFENGSKTFEGETNVPIIPSIDFAYKKDKWVFSGNFDITGGGGKATFENGLPSFESQVAMLPAMLNSAGVTAYSVESNMVGEQYDFGGQVGEAYKINDIFSVYGGLRVVMAKNKYTGYIRNIKINPGGGDMIPATTFANAIGNAELGAKVADKEIDCSQNGWGVTPIIGFDFKYNKLNVGIRYEYNTSLDVKNDTKTDDTGLFPDGAETANDIPGYLTVGAEYKIIEKLRISAGYHLFFDKQADMANDKQEYIDKNLMEYLGGLEFDVTNRITLSGGLQLTRTGVTDNYQSDLSYSLNSYSVGFGGSVKISEKVKANLGYFFTVYDDWTKASSNYNGTGFQGSDTYSRTNRVIGIGIDYKL